jgi:hypothetical protein
MNFETIIQQFHTQGIRLYEGSTPGVLSRLERRCQFKFPSSFTQFYLQANGFEDEAWTADMFSLWSLEKIGVEYEERLVRFGSTATFIPFCDYLIQSHLIGFLPNQLGIYKLYGSATAQTAAEIIPLCETFEQAVAWIASGAVELF